MGSQQGAAASDAAAARHRRNMEELVRHADERLRAAQAEAAEVARRQAIWLEKQSRRHADRAALEAREAELADRQRVVDEREAAAARDALRLDAAEQEVEILSQQVIASEARSQSIDAVQQLLLQQSTDRANETDRKQQKQVQIGKLVLQNIITKKGQIECDLQQLEDECRAKGIATA